LKNKQVVALYFAKKIKQEENFVKNTYLVRMNIGSYLRKEYAALVQE
jgi:hypothetical protein